MKFICIISLIVLTQSFFGCQKRLKNTDDYHPKLEVKVEIVLGGIKVTGEVKEEGVTPLEVVGFSFLKHLWFHNVFVKIRNKFLCLWVRNDSYII